MAGKVEADGQDHRCPIELVPSGHGPMALQLIGHRARPDGKIVMARAFDEKVESMIVDSHDGANRIQDPHWDKGASHEWGSLIPTICANVSLRQSKPVILVEEVAELYNMALSTVGGFIKRKRETGSVSPDKFGGYKTFALEPHTDLVKELVAEQPDSTLAELQVRLAKEKVKVSQSGISRFLHHINLTFKKKGLQGIEWVILRDHS